MSTILIIEDNPQSARLAKKLLVRSGHEVTIATTGEEGFIQASQAPPDLILMDLGLPDVDGQTIIGVMQQQPQLAKVPMIAFTAWPEETAADMAKAYGCTGVIIKPIDTKEFANQVEKFLPNQTDSSDPNSPSTSASPPDSEADGESPLNK